MIDEEFFEYVQRERKFELGCEGDCGICSFYKDGMCTYADNDIE